MLYLFVSPTVGYATQNLFMSFSALLVSVISLLFILPSSIVLTSFRREMSIKKVAVIIGAQDGSIGASIVKQHSNKPGTVIIFLKDLNKTFKLLSEELYIGHCKAKIICIELPNRLYLESAIRTIDEKYGPITHFYEASNASTYKIDPPIPPEYATESPEAQYNCTNHCPS
ncbi:hypothetical protein CPB84DRAFT_180463 [Gymnopilus junonius]|uniref:Uncharacterized protein n=1 Tax=Gymnopilus junonius TaxID=109634 RepID=A0A9P5TI68_GYMJU|nr:hypothetical protein CPB84DRAFT_180463 [Gymnopilus junonius]